MEVADAPGHEDACCASSGTAEDAPEPRGPRRMAKAMRDSCGRATAGEAGPPAGRHTPCVPGTRAVTGTVRAGGKAGRVPPSAAVRRPGFGSPRSLRRPQRPTPYPTFVRTPQGVIALLSSGDPSRAQNVISSKGGVRSVPQDRLGTSLERETTGTRCPTVGAPVTGEANHALLRL